MTNLKSSAPPPTIDARDVANNVESLIQNRPRDRDDADSELISLLTDEAVQAHKFRQWAFWGAFTASCALFAIWIGVMVCCWPEHWYTPAMTVLLGVKFSLCTLTSLTVAIAMLRFAIRCYGHHQSGSSNVGDSPTANMAQKILDVVGKALGQQQ